MKWVFWASATVIAYAYVGYPLWLWLRSWWSPRPVMRGTATPIGFGGDGGAERRGRGRGKAA